MWQFCEGGIKITNMRSFYRFIACFLCSLSLWADEKAPVPPSAAEPKVAPVADKPLTAATTAVAEKPIQQGTVTDTTGYSLETLVDGLNQANLQEAFRLLRSEYIKNEELDYLELNRAAIQGLLERLDFGAMLLTEASRSARNSSYAFYSTRISEAIGYIRFGKFTKDELSSFDQVITEFRDEEKIQTLILDLRSPQPQADFGIAAEILGRFRPPNELLFKIRNPGNERPTLFPSKPNEVSWGREIVVLVDQETGNVGEIIGAVLQRKNNSLVIGEKTKGLTVEYRDVPVGEDRILRFAVAEVILEDESSIFQKGITPDLPSTQNLAGKHAIFKATTTLALPDGGPQGSESVLAKYLFRKDRPRMNEAALVAGTDPELDYFVAKHNGRKTEWDAVLPEDNILQKSVDILLARNFLNSGKRRK